MRFGKNYPAALAALALVLSPAAAQAVKAKSKPISSKVKRAGPAMKQESKFFGGGVPIAVLLIGTAVLITTIVVASDGDDNPTSP